MTVRELIARLNTLDPDLPVAITVSLTGDSEMAYVRKVVESGFYTWATINDEDRTPCVHIE